VVAQQPNICYYVYERSDIVNIKKRRNELGITQARLGIECNVSLNTIRNWEQGVTKPSEKNMKRLKEVLKVK